MGCTCAIAAARLNRGLDSEGEGKSVSSTAAAPEILMHVLPWMDMGNEKCNTGNGMFLETHQIVGVMIHNYVYGIA